MTKPRPTHRSPAEAPIDLREPAVGTGIGPDLPKASFPIVGIGCSAGGLDALDRFFARAPTASGMAFVVIQHLDPTHHSNLPELLQRATAMPVVEISDGTAVQPDCVYVIPPNKDLALLRGALHLIDPTEPRGLRLPIDFFLRSLAEDCRELAIGVVLSGMGSDGVLGLRAIKEKSGLTLVQDPLSAQADSMPRSAIAAGLADVVAPPEELPGRIVDYSRRAETMALDKPVPIVWSESGLDKIVILLRDRTGHDFSLYKPSTLCRRVERRMALHRLGGIPDYVHYLRENPQELDLLFKELLIGVTSFFRDPAVWETLRQNILPAWIVGHIPGTTLRAWVPACSSGEEAYSLAIVLSEAVDQVRAAGRFALQIYATDLDPDAIDKARKGVYPKNIAADVSPERLARYFVADGDHYRVAKDIRDLVIFAPQNLIGDPPFTKLDLLSCRNLLIYLSQELQKRLLPLFHYALSPAGLLLLGTSESVGSFNYLFAPADGKTRIFRRLDHALPLTELSLPSGVLARLPIPADATAELAALEDSESLGQLTDRLIQQTYAPPAVLVTADGDILYISGRTGKYLEHAAGKVNVNIHAMAREGLREALAGAIRKALRQSQPLSLDGVPVGTNGGTQLVDVVVQGIDRPALLRGRVLVVFHDVATAHAGGKARKPVAATSNDDLMQELMQARETLRANHEEAQTSLEELKSANEELQSTIEELQSTNEELTTSKEELQSLNEELQTVNAELQSKVADLTWERNDMTNLLNSTQIATVFLDNQLRLRRFTELTTRLFKLIPGDIGRPLSDIVTDLQYPSLQEDFREVLRTLVFCEKQVGTRDGRWYRVRIMPYRTHENVIDGLVITFIDITDIKRLEAELRRREPAPEGGAAPP